MWLSTGAEETQAGAREWTADRIIIFSTIKKKTVGPVYSLMARQWSKWHKWKYIFFYFFQHLDTPSSISCPVDISFVYNR